MALIVEDGTGKANADAYVSVDALKAFCAARGYETDDYDDSEFEPAIRKATDYINTQFRFKGARLNAAQTMEFPRSDLFDWSAHPVLGLPKRVADACCDLAFKALAAPLYQDQDRGGKVKSESVAGISVTYADDAPTGMVWQQANNYLQPYVKPQRDSMRVAPMFGGATGGAIALGMHAGADAADASLLE